MPPPVVGSSAAAAASSSSSSEAWRAQQQTPPPCSSSLQPKSFSRGGDDWFLPSQRDSQILTQALTRELSSTKDPASTSSKSFAETLSLCLEGKASWHSKNSEDPCGMRTLQKKPISSGLLQQNTVDGFLQHQQGFLQKESPLSSDPASPLSASTEKPESPFNTSSLSANSTMSMTNTIATESFAAQQHQTHTKLNNPHLQDVLNLSLRAALKSEEASRPFNNTLFSPRTASIALSSQASAGAGGTKVSKRRSRANNKAPIAVLSADTSNFRAMVQQLTGIPAPPSIQHYGPQILGSPGVPLLKPHPTRPPYNGILNMPTLDTSASFLGLRPIPMKDHSHGFSFLQRSHQLSSGPLSGANFAAELGVSQEIGTNNMLQGNLPHDIKCMRPNHQASPINYGISSSSALLPGLWDPRYIGKSRGNCPTYKEDLKQASSQGLMREADHLTVRQSPTALESLLLEEDLHTKSSYNAVDSWLSFDGPLANHAPKMEIARIA